MYDPAFVADPRAVGVLDNEGRPVEDPVLPPIRATRPEDLPADEPPRPMPLTGPIPDIQTPDSADAP
jgi:hypothetical protein